MRNFAPHIVAAATLAAGAALVARSPIPHTAWWTVAVAAACSVACGLLGCYLVLRRMSLLGDAISHGVLPGIALAFLVTGRINGLPVVVGAMALGLLTALLTQTLRDYGRVPEDSSMGVVFTSLFALGVIMITRFAAQVDLDPGCVLYGLLEFVALDTTDVLGVAVPRAFVTLGATLVLVVAFIGVFWKELKIASFDPGLASAMGISAGIVHYLLMAMVAGATVASFEAVGSILVVAMFIVPGATAHLLTDRLAPMLLWSVVVSVASALYGYVLARMWDTNYAGMMAVVAGGQFALAVFFAPRHGLLVKWLGNVRLAFRIAAEDIVAELFRREETAGARLGVVSTEEPAGHAELPGPWATMLRGIATWRLVRLAWLDRTVDGGVMLTERGREAGRRIVRAHRLWESYLDRHFELPLDHVHAPAERMEHFLGPELQTELASQLEEPDRDPHGRAIPAP